MKLTVIGGGGVRSLMLAKSLAQNAKEYNITHIVFMDNNVQKLNIFGALAREVAIRIMPSLDFTLTTNPVEAIQSADYIITTIRAGEDDMRIRDERIALAHNGNLTNSFELREALEIDPALTGVDLLYAEGVVADMLENQKEKYPRFFRE